LTNTCLKLLTKLVANRLQNKIKRCIHENQYGLSSVELFKPV
jgi:hypothetical protein